VNSRTVKILLISLILVAPGLFSRCWAANYMSGAASLYYNSYDAEVDGKQIGDGTSFAQKYSLSYTATNRMYKRQQNYYALKFGYDWIDFNTDITRDNTKLNLSQSFGKFNYSAAVGYNPPALPISFSAYSNDVSEPFFEFDTNSISLIESGLVYNIAGQGQSTSSGFSFAFLPDKSTTATLRDLPQLMVAYRETNINDKKVLNRTDRTTKEFSASLSKGDNWLNYWKLDYENFLDPLDVTNYQRLQIGHVDNRGQRNWSLLTNWMTVSVDGSLLNSTSLGTMKEVYDVNAMAIANFRLWNARTFMNYNREFDSITLTEEARVPVYVKGIYGSSTDWYLNLGADRGRQKLFLAKDSTASGNAVSVGGTTFKNAEFTLSPAVSLVTRKEYEGLDTYQFSSSLEAVSTRRFSNTLGLAGKVAWQAMDDGTNSSSSKSWTTFLDLNGSYAPNSRVSYTLQERIEAGSGDGFLATYRQRYGRYTASDTNVGTYLRNYLAGSARWTPTAQFSMSLEASYDIASATDLPASTVLKLNYRTAYENREASFRFTSVYEQRKNGFESEYSWASTGAVGYRPDRYTDGLFQFTQSIQRNTLNNTSDVNRTEVLQRYSYNFFTRSGVQRNYATLSEEYVYASADAYGAYSDDYRLNSSFYNLSNNATAQKSSNQYLKISGRYSPVERIALYGSAKYNKDSLGKTMYYTAGLSAYYNLFNGSLEYVYARRDSDKRQEKRFTAALNRTF